MLRLVTAMAGRMRAASRVAAPVARAAIARGGAHPARGEHPARWTWPRFASSDETDKGVTAHPMAARPTADIDPPAAEAAAGPTFRDPDAAPASGDGGGEDAQRGGSSRAVAGAKREKGDGDGDDDGEEGEFDVQGPEGKDYRLLHMATTTPDGETVAMTAVEPWEVLCANTEYVPPEGWRLEDFSENGFTIDDHPFDADTKLSDYSKTEMYLRHKSDPETWTAKRLAAHYNVRQQRVLAIIALKDIQRKWELEGRETCAQIDVNYAWHDGIAHHGNGERHQWCHYHKANYQVVPTHFTPERVVEALPPYVSKQEKADIEDRHMLRRFKRDLDYNLMKTGPGLLRSGRFKQRRKRPEGGWPLMVIPMNKDNSTKRRKQAKRRGDVAGSKIEMRGTPWVAYPDGTKREINEDEKVMFERRKISPFRRIGVT